MSDSEESSDFYESTSDEEEEEGEVVFDENVIEFELFKDSGIGSRIISACVFEKYNKIVVCKESYKNGKLYVHDTKTKEICCCEDYDYVSSVLKWNEDQLLLTVSPTFPKNYVKTITCCEVYSDDCGLTLVKEIGSLRHKPIKMIKVGEDKGILMSEPPSSNIFIFNNYKDDNETNKTPLRRLRRVNGYTTLISSKGFKDCIFINNPDFNLYKIKLVNYETFEVVHQYVEGHKKCLWCLSSYIDDTSGKEILVAGGDEKILFFYDSATEKCIKRVSFNTIINSFFCLARKRSEHHPKGILQLYVGSYTGKLICYDVRCNFRKFVKRIHKKWIGEIVNFNYRFEKDQRDLKLLVCSETLKMVDIRGGCQDLDGMDFKERTEFVKNEIMDEDDNIGPVVKIRIINYDVKIPKFISLL